jgi:hypothetical protein
MENDSKHSRSIGLLYFFLLIYKIASIVMEKMSLSDGFKFSSLREQIAEIKVERKKKLNGLHYFTSRR